MNLLAIPLKMNRSDTNLRLDGQAPGRYRFGANEEKRRTTASRARRKTSEALASRNLCFFSHKCAWCQTKSLDIIYRKA